MVDPPGLALNSLIGAMAEVNSRFFGGLIIDKELSPAAYAAD